MARVVFLDVGGTLWPNAWPALQGDREERIARHCSTAPRLLAAQAAEFVDALSADIYATGLGTPGPGGPAFGLLGVAIQLL
jgi:hypothetical protein